MASRADRQPAVFGSTLTPRSCTRSKNFCPVPPPADSRRSETVTTETPDALTAAARTAGDGYPAVPSNMREVNGVP